ncbi:MAG: hypothetical protein AAF199_01255 [Pseudomonadota bacterium]
MTTIQRRALTAAQMTQQTTSGNRSSSADFAGRAPFTSAIVAGFTSFERTISFAFCPQYSF